MRIVDISVKRPVSICMFIFAVLLFGFVSLSRLSVNLLPELSYPSLTIRTDYQGAAPGELEQLVTKPIEEAIGIVKGVRNVTSVSKAEQSDVVLEFEWGTEMDLASLEVREKLDVVQLPLDVKKPLLLKFNPSLDPIVRMGLKLKSDTQDPQALKRLRTYADEELKRKLESVTGVASIRLGGGLENEIQIALNQQKTNQLGISPAQVIERLRQENINRSGGRVEDGVNDYLVRTLNQFQSLQDIRDIYVTSLGDRHIRLSDIATVSDSHKERDSITRIHGQEAVEIAVYKEGDANTVEVATKLKQRIARLNKDIPDEYELVVVYDQSRFIANAISEVKSAAVIGGLLSMLVLYFFLKNIWPTLIISLSIPVSVIATFNLMYGNDISLNIMSLGGIALAIGLLVDNSIVVLENIARRKEAGESAQTSATQGTKEVGTAIFASTLTTIAVFFPLVFVEGIAGQLFRDQALTVTFALICSLVVALTLIPMLASREKSAPIQAAPEHIIKPRPTSKLGLAFHYLALPFRVLIQGVFYYLPLIISTLMRTTVRALSKVLGVLSKPILFAFDKTYQAVENSYKALLSAALKARLVTLTAVLALAGLSYPLIDKLGMELIPRLSQGEFFVEITLPAGTRIEETDALVQRLTQRAQSMEQVEKTYSMAGTGSLMNASSAQGGDYWGRLNVVLKPQMSKMDEVLVMAQLRDFLRQIPGVEAKFSRPELFSFKTPLEVHISGYDLGQLKRYADAMADKMDASGQFMDIKSNLKSGHPELKIYFDHSRLSQLGLNAPDIAELLSAKVGGQVATQYSLRDRKIDVLVRSDEESRNSIADIRNMTVNPGAAYAIPLSAVAKVEESIGPSEITRVDQQRVAIISADIQKGDLGEAVVEAQALLNQLKLPANLQAKISGQSEEMETSFRSLMLALALAVFLVYLVMASQFESLLHPLLILFTVPLAAAGSVYGLYLTDTKVSVIVFIGLIMLAGIVVNNAIVLVDKINQLREAGTQKQEAITIAAHSRLRPILMTTLTTTLGLIPLAMGVGEGAELRAPMAISVISGLLFSTLLTLLFIPALYSLLDSKRFEPQTQAQEA